MDVRASGDEHERTDSEPAPADGGLPAFAPHPLRAAAVGEIHARPFRLISTPRVFLRYGFLTDDAATAAADRSWLLSFCAAHGVPPPAEEARHHLVPLGGGTLRWERHGEFTTYTWDAPGGVELLDRVPPAHPFGAGFRAPGPLLVATRLDVLRHDEAVMEAALRRFDAASLALSEVDGGVIASDFRQDRDGLTRFLLADRRLTPQQIGALALRLLEVETYRTLAMLGLPQADRQVPVVARIEAGLLEIVEKMRSTTGLDVNRALLEDLTGLAAELEASAAASAYRFGASRAYAEIVRQRLEVIGEIPVQGYFTFSQFLNRRMAPAMRTCQTLEDRQKTLSEKLARAATLLRTRVDVELEQQNRDLLVAMNTRARLQLRLQQTVEGLSVAAVSYYVVGLAGYLFKGAKEAGLPALDPALATAAAVPIAVLLVWGLVRRIRRHHAEHD